MNNGMDMVVLPTNRKTCCILIPIVEDKKDASNIGTYWDPTLDDLIAKDWILEE
ncbi:hypothetical protein [Enterococcus sp. DIV0086]|uniref:hypothetical protein n=1 Tax=Enterococcus sp. DIV0086 TaxID=2774655 RepID=UPI003D2B18E9